MNGNCCGEDAYSISENQFQSVVAICDGVGSWRKKGIDPSKFSKSIVNNVKFFVENSNKFLDTKNLLKLSFWKLLYNYRTGEEKPFGSSTACIVSLSKKDALINATNLGDSGFLIYRKGELIFKSKSQQHRFNCPYQIKLDPSGSISDQTNLASTYDFKGQNGDIVILTTDGMLDNLHDTHISHVINKFNSSVDKPQLIANNLVRLARYFSEKSDYISPFSEEAKRSSVEYIGGKQDDISLIVAEIKTI